MLQEILLSLAGVPSPVWQKLREKQKEDVGLGDYISLPEQAMLANLHHIGQLHIELKEHCATVSSKHPSLICRAISSSIAHTHLADFRRAIVDVERSIITGDSSHVGGYQIVPLSTLVADFAPWTRRLEWLRKVTQTMKGSKSKRSSSSCTGAAILDYLKIESHTGYSDIERMANELLIVAQTTWMRAVASWVLYGQLPTAGTADFMIKQDLEEELYEQYVLDKTLIPDFVSNLAAESILAIGDAVRHTQNPAVATQAQSSRGLATSLLTSHLSSIKLLQFPLNPSLFESTMVAINESVSRHALSSLLPKSQVFKVCMVLRDYMLIGRGEFAVTLIENSNERVLARTKNSFASRPVRKLGRIDNMILKDSELNSILSKTWSDLIGLQGEIEAEDTTLDLARTLMRLKCRESEKEQERDVCLSTILPVPTFLSVEMAPNSPLKMFLPRTCVQQYSRLSSFLLSIRRSQLRISSLWKMTSHRRCHPTPLGPPTSTTEFGRRACRQRRAREGNRASQMRRFWSTMSKSLFLLNEFNSYLHSEVIRNSWDQFEHWLLRGDHQTQDLATLDSKRPLSRESLHSDIEQNQERSRQAESTIAEPTSSNDPRTTTNAHLAYLTALVSALLLDEADLIRLIKSFLEQLDHMIALFARLSTVWEGLDLQEDDGIMDAFSNFAQDEKEILTEMDRARTELEPLLKQIVEALKEIDKVQNAKDISGTMASVGISHGAKSEFIPWSARTLDRLIMKLDFLYTKEERGEDLVGELGYD